MGDPRRVAYAVLRAVDERDAYANLELADQIAAAGLDPRDAALATELTAGTLRLRGSYDPILDSLVARELDPGLRDALRLGTHQLLSMRTPPHAAVSTTVALVRKEVGHKVAGLTNAVLRRVAQRSLDEWFDELQASQSVRTSHPQWIVDELAEALGDDPAAVLAADNLAPRVTLCARPGLSTVEELMAAGAAAHPASPLAVELAGNPGQIAAVREGRAAVQDAGSQVVALLLANATVGTDGAWLDMCAGPGGKAGLLAAIAAERGATLLANERAPHRARLVRQALRLTPAGVIAGDGTQPPWRDGSFDRVLLDAPCSGLGALRRRPEARWRRQPSDLDELVPLQIALLHKAIDALRPGGVVAYATCSPVVRETAAVVQNVLDARSDAEVEDATALVPWLAEAESIHLPGAVQLWPHRHNTDAMFTALIRRT